MPNYQWVLRSFDELLMNEDDKKELVRFWTLFYNIVLEKYAHYHEHSVDTKSAQYKDEVFDILDRAKGNFPLSDVELRKIQMEIEDLTLAFDEESMFKSASNIIKTLIRENECSAKDYLKSRKLDEDDMELLSEFGHYTIEALIVHVLCMVFNSLDYNPIIRVASLVERLESSVRTQASLLKSRRSKCKTRFSSINALFQEDLMSGKEVKRSKLERMYPFGTFLVNFMVERDLITLISDLNGTRVTKKKGAYFLPSNLYAVCNFDLSLLPIKLNLPMVCPPLDWGSACPEGQMPHTLSDLSGGYLSGPTGEIVDRYRLLSTGDINHFYIEISSDKEGDRYEKEGDRCEKEGDRYANLCRVMNTLQRQAFQINSDWLKYIQDNEYLLVEYGYLMPRYLASMNIKDVSNLLRELHMKDEVINQLCSFSNLLNTLNKNIQRSRYERLIIKMARAYEGYHFYLPAFLDFRGRIYRSGILHFHERDLARSLIVFADSKSYNFNENTSLAAAAFHYKSFASVGEGYDWFCNNLSEQIEVNNLFAFARGAKRPFQFLANIIGLVENKLNRMPIVQDASASAYQIMSYLLLDESMAKRTNLIPSSDGQIQDVYSFLLEELKEFMKAELENNLSTIVCSRLTRKLVKAIFMPMIYGKTLMSTASDLEDHLSHFITKRECFTVASVCFKFWKWKFPGMECLIRLIRHIGWFSSARNFPVFYKAPYFTTVQDYMVMDAINIWLYDSLHKKRRRVTLRVPSQKRDRRKTEVSTFVNFIHQKDAQIAMSVVEYMLSISAPIYTVHDNFITTAQYSDLIPSIYSGVIREMGPPLLLVNEFIYMNVIKPFEKRGLGGPTVAKSDQGVISISKETLYYYLKANVPENLTKKKMATWEERISGILTCYENYKSIVCDDFHSSNPMDCWRAHEKKWNKFQSKLKSERGIPHYCVHY